jgi:hypothetical protein
MPKFLLTIYDVEAGWAALSEEDAAKATQAYADYSSEVQDKGAFLAGEGLQPTMTAKTVTSDAVTDGPFAETKEQLGGFYLLECKDEAEAIDWARKVPSVAHMGGKVEVRPVQEFPDQE